jgi:hypothetical protein
VVVLQGRALDPQDGVLTATNALTWISSRDGVVGKGDESSVQLSAGVHTIMLVARDSVGLTATASITLNVQPDYAGVGVSDAFKESIGLNRLRFSDAFSLTSSGVPLIQQALDEAQYNTPVTSRDNTLSVVPDALNFLVDLSQGDTLPQQVLGTSSQEPVSVTFSSNVPWLDLSATSGQTPSPLTVVLNPIDLQQGMQSGWITMTSDIGTVYVPVTATVTNKASFCDVDRDGHTNAADIAAVQARVGSVLGQPNYDYHYDVNRDGVIDATDVTLITTCVNTYGSAWQMYLPVIRH